MIYADHATWSIRFTYDDGFRAAIGEARLYGTGEIAGVEIYKEHRGNGYGRVMMLALLARADTLYRFAKTFLYVKKDNAAAIRLYVSLGFRPESCSQPPRNPDDLMMVRYRGGVLPCPTCGCVKKGEK